MTTAITPAAAVNGSLTVVAPLTTAIPLASSVSMSLTTSADLLTVTGTGAQVNVSLTATAGLTTAIRLAASVTGTFDYLATLATSQLSLGNIYVSPTLVGAGSYYHMYFTDTPSGPNYGETGALTVQDGNGNPIAGTFSSATLAFSFDYFGNNQGGRTPGTDANIAFVVGRPGYIKPTVVEATLTNSEDIALVVPVETDLVYV